MSAGQTNNLNRTAAELMSMDDLAARTQLSKSFWYARISEGAIRHYRLGPGRGGIRISEEQYQDYLRRREQGGGEAPKDPAPRVKSPELKHLER